MKITVDEENKQIEVGEENLGDIITWMKQHYPKQWKEYKIVLKEKQIEYIPWIPNPGPRNPDPIWITTDGSGTYKAGENLYVSNNIPDDKKSMPLWVMNDDGTVTDRKDLLGL